MLVQFLCRELFMLCALCDEATPHPSLLGKTCTQHPSASRENIPGFLQLHQLIDSGVQKKHML